MQAAVTLTQNNLVYDAPSHAVRLMVKKQLYSLKFSSE